MSAFIVETERSGLMSAYVTGMMIGIAGIVLAATTVVAMPM